MKTSYVRKSDRELVVSRVINGPAKLVFQAWTQPELFKKWWVPKSVPIQLTACEMDVRTGGTYRLVFSAGSESMAFFGKYLEVTPFTKIVWTNEEGGAEASTITTVTFEETKGATLVTVHDLYPSKEALDEALATGTMGGMPEQLEQLEQVLSESK